MGWNDDSYAIFGGGNQMDSVHRFGNQLFDGAGSYHTMGDTTFCPSGDAIHQFGSQSFLPNGETVFQCGQMSFVGSDSYHLCGSTLFGPDGRTWYGVREQDVPILIHKDRSGR